MQLRDTWYNTRGIITAIIANPNENWTDMFSLGQLESKFWIVEELEALNVNLGTVFICGGWFGSLANMIFTSNVQVDKIRSFDIDPSCLEIAEAMNRDYVIDKWKFKAVTEDMYNINYTGHTYNTTRCTSPFAYDNTLVECLLTQQSELVGKSLMEINFRRRFGSFILAIRREGAWIVLGFTP